MTDCSLYFTVHCTGCVSVCRFTKLAPHAHVTHMFSVHMDIQSHHTCINFICSGLFRFWIFSQLISFICSFVGRPAWKAWNSKNEHCTITQYISDIFINEEATYSWLHAAERRIPSAWQTQETNLKFKEWRFLSQATYLCMVCLTCFALRTKYLWHVGQTR